MMDWTPPPPLACSLTPIHAPTPPIGEKWRLERLTFLFGKLLEKICRELESHGLSADRLDLKLGLRDRNQSVILPFQRAGIRAS